MKTAFFSLAAALLMASAAPAAYAVTNIPLVLPAPGVDGSISAFFGDQSIALGDFTDVFTFTLPDGVTAASLTSTMQGAATDINFVSADLNGHGFSFDLSGTDEHGAVHDVLTVAGTQTLTVHGTSGGNGSFGGNISFETAPPIITGGGGVPEPAAWALMILGFGGAGSMLRAKRRMTNFA